MAEDSVQTYLTQHKISTLFEVMLCSCTIRYTSTLCNTTGVDVKGGQGATIRPYRLPHQETADPTQTKEKGIIGSSLFIAAYYYLVLQGSPHVASISPSKASRGRIEVTGTSVTSKTPTNTKCEALQCNLLNLLV